MARTKRSLSILRGALAAKRLHKALNLQEIATSGVGFIDVFGAIHDLGIPLVFKPVEALGWYLPRPLNGILVTSKRPLHIQRFTGAHELGHSVLEHRASLDKFILERTPPNESDGRDLQEVEADAFAAEFLLPKWLFKHHVEAQGWTVNADLRNPDVVYQLSLRVAASYQATCWGLISHQILSYQEGQKLLKAKVANLKSKVGGEFRPSDSWADTWSFTEKDDSASVLGNPDDLIKVELDENAGGGFQWDLDKIEEAGYELLSDASVFDTEYMSFGSVSKRVLIFRPKNSGQSLFRLNESQPWRAVETRRREFKIKLMLSGQEEAGMSHAQRVKAGLSS